MISSPLDLKLLPPNWASNSSYLVFALNQSERAHVVSSVINILHFSLNTQTASSCSKEFFFRLLLLACAHNSAQIYAQHAWFKSLELKILQTQVSCFYFGCCCCWSAGCCCLSARHICYCVSVCLSFIERALKLPLLPYGISISSSISSIMLVNARTQMRATCFSGVQFLSRSRLASKCWSVSVESKRSLT